MRPFPVEHVDETNRKLNFVRQSILNDISTYNREVAEQKRKEKKELERIDI